MKMNPIPLGRAFIVYEDVEKELRMIYEVSSAELAISNDDEDFLVTDWTVIRTRPPKVALEGRLVEGKIWSGGDPFGPKNGLPRPAIEEGVVEGELIDDDDPSEGQDFDWGREN
jgi:hypothetical protein